MGDHDLSCTIYLPSLVMKCPVVFVLKCTHTHIHTRTYRADKRPTYSRDYLIVYFLNDQVIESVTSIPFFITSLAVASFYVAVSDRRSHVVNPGARLSTCTVTIKHCLDCDQTVKC